MNLTPAQKVRLGAFLLTGAGILVVTLLTLAGLKMWETRIQYTARFHENVSGLERSAPVKYQGLRIGRVERMRVSPDDPSAIEVTLSVDPETLLFEGTTAVLDSSGLTGLKTINLTPGDPRKPRLQAGAVLPTGASLIDKITDHAAVIVADVKRVADQLTHWASDDNRVRLESLLVNLDSFVGHLDTIMMDQQKPVGQAVVEVGKAATAMSEAASEITKTLYAVRQTLDSTQQELHNTLQAYQRPMREIDPKEVARTVASIRGAAARLDERLSAQETGKAIASFGDTVSRVNRLIQDVDMVVRASREDFTASLSYMRQATEDIREFSRILAQNPSVLVRGRGEAGE
jgi:phospholipid/cholesterol/gamma-HCH transport system substrate-binding protein